MRNLLLFLSTFLFSTILLAQTKPYKAKMENFNSNFYEVVDEAETYFSTHDNGKGSGFKGYMRWKVENESKYFPSGDRTNVDPFLVSNAYERLLNENPQFLQRTPNAAGWRDLGPYDANNITTSYNPGIGRIESLWVDPANDQTVYLGSRSGGFWKSLNGGTTWENTTDFLFASGVNTITVNPSNLNEILINVRNANNGNTHGIYRSTDGGNTWLESNFNPTNLGFGGLGNNNTIYKVLYHPSIANLVFVGTSEGLYRSADNLNTWTQHFGTDNIIDIEFHPSNNNKIYAYIGNQNEVQLSNDQGLNWTTSNTIVNNDNSKGHLAVSPAAPSNLYFASSNGIWKSTDEGQNFTFITNPDESCQGFAISDLDASKIIYGYVDIEASTTDEATYEQVTDWASSNPDATYVHADLRVAESINGVFYIGTDGYLAKSSDNGQNWTRINDGTGVRENYAFGISQSHYRTFMGGSQDNGTSILYKGNWIEWNGGDGMEAIVHPLNEDWMIGSWQFGTRNRTKDGGQTRNGIGTPQSGGDQAYWIAAMFYDPLNQMDFYHCSDSIFKATKFGDDWEYVGTPNIGEIEEGAIAFNNSQIIAVANGSDLRLSTDGGATFSNIESNLPNHDITDLEFDPNFDSTIVVTFNRHQADGEKVFISFDLGATWNNITHNLTDMPIRDVVIDHTADRNIYLGAEIGVYYKAMGDNTWTLYNPDLPNVTIRELEINNGTNTIVAATWGRGFWEYDLVGRANFPSILTTDITDTPTELTPLAGSNQYVTSTINYDGTLSSVQLLWSANDISLSNSINMTNTTDSTWVSDTFIPSNNSGDKIYFKVIAIGSNNDTTETFRFMYDVISDCILNNVSITVNECNNNGTISDPNDDFYTFTINANGVNTGSTYSISGDAVLNGIDYGVDRIVDNNGNGIPIGTDFLITIQDDDDSFCTDNFLIQSPGNCYNPNPNCAESELITIPGTYTATGPSIGNGALNSGATNANWFTFVAPFDAEVTVSSCLKGEDTRVWIYEGDCNTLNAIANNDDACEMTLGSNQYASLVDFCVSKDATYFIEWDDRWTDDGFDFDIEVNQFECATKCNIIDVQVSIDSCFDNGTAGFPFDDFYNFSLQTSGVLLGNSFDIIGDFSVSNLLHDTLNTVSIDLASTQTYNITLVDNDSLNCTYDFQLEPPEACQPPNETCVASKIIEIPGSFTADGPASGNGAINNNAEHSDWFTFIAPANGQVNISSCLKGIDTRVWVYNGDCSNPNLLANNDDACEMTVGGSAYASSTNFCAIAGRNYFLEWDNRWSDSGFDFDVAIDVNAAACETCVDSIEIYLTNVTDTLYNANNFISANGKIANGNNVKVHSGEAILLKNNFECEEDVDLEIYIEDCISNQ